MKKYIELFVLVSCVFISCNTAKTSFNQSSFEVASSVREVPKDMIGPNSADEAITVSEQPEIAYERIEESEPLLALETSPSDKTSPSDNEAQLNAIKIMIANDLREASKTIDSRIAQRIISKTANSVEMSSAESKQKMSFMQKIQMKVLDKIVSKRGSSARMDLGDIFAIVSLASGIIAILPYYQGIFFGVAAIVFGAIALARGTSRRGMAIAGIVLGVLAIIFGSIWFVAAPWY